MRAVIVLLLTPCLLAVAGCGCTEAPNAGEKKPAKIPKPRFTIGVETTHLNGPLNEHGYVDYAAALNKHFSKGVTPKNNACVPLIKAIGPELEGKKIPADVFRSLGIEPPPAKGAYFVNYKQFLKTNLKKRVLDDIPLKYFDQQFAASERPWKSGRHVEVDKWLKVNEKPLSLVHEATQRSRFYFPLVADEPKKSTFTLTNDCRAHLIAGRWFQEALNARAMLHLGEGRRDEAWKDIVACHRLGRLLIKRGTTIDVLVALSLEATATHCEIVLLSEAQLTKQELLGCVRDLKALPPFGNPADTIDLYGRCEFLETIVAAPEVPDYIKSELRFEVPDKKPMQELIPKYDTVLQRGNQWHDRIVAAMRLKDRHVRNKRLKRIEKELDRLAKDQVVHNELDLFFRGKRAYSDAIGRSFGDLLCMAHVFAYLHLQKLFDRTSQIILNREIAFTLALYKCDNGTYPQRLKQLTPKYMTNVSKDVFTSNDLIYRPAKNGYLLYSVGFNEQDDGGRNWRDEPRGDDIAVRMPLPKLR